MRLAQHTRTVLACCLVTLALGSLHAFSLFTPGFEQLFSASRADVSLIYSIALVSLTASVLVGPRLFSRWTPAQLMLSACTIAACGLAVAAFAEQILSVYLSYGVLFGTANGVAYGFSLVVVSTAWPQRKGMAMGLVTACYSMSAALSAPLLDALLTDGNITVALSANAVAIFIAGLIAGWMLYGLPCERVDATIDATADSLRRSTWLIWIAYGSSVAAGLMAIGHAAGIVASRGAAEWIAAGAIAISCGSAFGGVLAGWLADRIAIKTLLTMLPLLSAVGLALSALTDTAMLTLFALVIVGASYGAIIAAYPAAMPLYFGARAAAAYYGRVFTAWGFFGLLAPWLAGFLYDQTGDYNAALWSAATLAMVAAAIVRSLPKPQVSHG